ncbi:MAG: hypothetical protein MUO26_10020 [Methanotrichaceae archaeon]|nr:hypothetical protein [Methanotrichaceae archaeon]
MQLVVFFLLVQVMPVYGDVTELGGVEGTVTSDSIMGYQENDVTNFLVADGTIQSAVDNANPGDIINLLERIYRENVHIEKSLSLIGTGVDKTIVDGDTDNDGVGNGRVFYIGPGIDVTLADMTIRNGNAYNDPTLPLFGGGILNQGNLTIENCDIYDNVASRGGGILSWAFGENDVTTLTVKNSQIHNNTAQWGGGIYNRAENGTAIAFVENCEVYDNVAEWKHYRDMNSYLGYKYALGGGILNFAQDGTSIMTVDKSDIHHNIAESGGGICSLAASQSTVKNPTTILNVLDSDIHDNSAISIYGENTINSIYGSGGGISSIGGNYWAQKNATAILNVVNSNIYNNNGSLALVLDLAAYMGGGIYNCVEYGNTALSVKDSDIHDNIGSGIYNYIPWQCNSSVTVEKSSIQNNTAFIGGGISNRISGNVLMTVEMSNIQNNTAWSSGGGISNKVDYGNAALFVKSCDIHDNSGGGISNDVNGIAILSVQDSNIYNNIATGNGGGIFNQAFYGSNSIISVQNSDIYNNTALRNGGGIYNDAFGNATLSVEDSNIYNNKAKEAGGGICNIAYYGNATLSVQHSDIHDNTASDGGGIYNSALGRCEGNGSNAIVSVTNSNIYGNSANNGSGIYNDAIFVKEWTTFPGTATVFIMDGDIYNNTASKDGGGIFNNGTLNIENSNILYNTADTDKNDDYTGHGGGIFYTEGNEPILLGINQITDNTPDDIYPPMT